MSSPTQPQHHEVQLAAWQTQFERALQDTVEALRLAGLGHYRAAGNVAWRLPNQQRLFTAVINGLQPGPASLVDFEDFESHPHLQPGLKEVVPLQVAILQGRPEANAVIHLHSPYLTGFAAAARPLPNSYPPLLARVDGDIPVAAWGPRYDPAPVQRVLRERPDAPAVLLANHGPFVWGTDVADATRLLITLEEAAHVFFVAQQLGGVAAVPADAYARVQAGRRRFVRPTP